MFSAFEATCTISWPAERQSGDTCGTFFSQKIKPQQCRSQGGRSRESKNTIVEHFKHPSLPPVSLSLFYCLILVLRSHQTSKRNQIKCVKQQEIKKC